MVNGKCPNCGAELVCGKCGHTEPFFVFMISHHTIAADCVEVALAENVQQYLWEVWAKLMAWQNVLLALNGDLKPPIDLRIPVQIGQSMYRFVDSCTPKAPSGRVERMPVSIYCMYGNSFKEPKEYRERRSSDKKTMEGHLASRHIQHP